ncbi:MAG: hypothetical protein ACEPOW_06760 [Bacteroidales bacterium]
MIERELILNENSIELIRVGEYYHIDRIDGTPVEGGDDPTLKHKEKKYSNSRIGRTLAGLYANKIMDDGGCVKLWMTKSKSGAEKIHVKEIDC